MKLIALARDSYEDYFRRELLEEAERDGVDVRFVGFRRREGRIDLVRERTVVRSLPLTATPRSILEFACAGNEAGETILLNTAGYNWFWHVLYLRYAIPRAFLVFDVHDWLYYDATFPKVFAMRCVDWLYRKTSDGVMLLSPELLPHYPGGFVLDNASHIEGGGAEKSQSPEVAVLASFDNRLDFELLERLLDLLPEVRFHFHGWVRAEYPGVQDRLHALCQRGNAYYHGPYENAELETLLASYRVGLIPYATTNRVNRYVNPDKIYHYLRAGMEVVATPIPQARRMEDYVHVAATATEFASRISTLLGGKEGKHPGRLGSRFHWSERWPSFQRFLATLTAR